MMPKLDDGPDTEPYTQVPKSYTKCVVPDKRLTSTEKLLIYFVIEKTYGFHKEEDTISNSQFSKATGLALSTVETALKNALASGYISCRNGPKYKGLEKIYRYNPPSEKTKFSTIKGGKSNNDLIKETL